jgi:electron transfer flavoprotein alpha/beta subunit
MHQASSGFGADPCSSHHEHNHAPRGAHDHKPYDLFALEEALRLRDKFGGEVTLPTMGPPSAEDSLRKAPTLEPTAPSS